VESLSGCWLNSVEMAREEGVESGGASEGGSSRIGGGGEGSLIDFGECSVVRGFGDESCIGTSTSISLEWVSFRKMLVAVSCLGRMVGFLGERRSQRYLCEMTEGFPHLGVIQCSFETGRWVGGPRKEDLCKWGLM